MRTPCLLSVAFVLVGCSGAAAPSETPSTSGPAHGAKVLPPPLDPSLRPARAPPDTPSDQDGVSLRAAAVARRNGRFPESGRGLPRGRALLPLMQRRADGTASRAQATRSSPWFARSRVVVGRWPPPARHHNILAEHFIKESLGRTLRRYAEGVPRPRRDLTTPEKRHLHSLEGRMARLEAELQATRSEWADLAEDAGQAAVARELGVSPQAVADRLRRIRANREGRSGRR